MGHRPYKTSIFGTRPHVFYVQYVRRIDKWARKPASAFSGTVCRISARERAPRTVPGSVRRPPFEYDRLRRQPDTAGHVYDALAGSALLRRPRAAMSGNRAGSASLSARAGNRLRRIQSSGLNGSLLPCSRWTSASGAEVLILRVCTRTNTAGCIRSQTRTSKTHNCSAFLSAGLSDHFGNRLKLVVGLTRYCPASLSFRS